MQILLFFKQNYTLITDSFYFMQLANIRTMKKSSTIIYQKLKSMPNCTFQIAWKTYRGILNFKQLPSDIITVYKKDTMLRIDYNIDNIEHPIKGKHFTILIKSQTQKDIQFYQIRHHDKTILNKLTSIDMNTIKQRSNEFCKYPQSRNSYVQNCNGMYTYVEEKGGKKINLTANFNILTEMISPQIKKNVDYKKSLFENVEDYEKQIINSQLVNYEILDHSELKTVIQENMVNEKLLPYKLKSKTEKHTIDLQMQMCQESINLGHFQFIMSFFQADSLLINKLMTVFKTFQNDDVFGKVNLIDMLPNHIKLNLQKDLTFQINIKNIMYRQISDSVFNVQCKVVQQMNYEQNINPRVLMQMQQTMLSEEGYSINVSQFLGKTQKLLEIQDLFARDKFEALLTEQFHNEQFGQTQYILDELEDN